MRLTAWGFWIPVAPLVGARGLKLHDDGRRAKRAHVAPLVGARGLNPPSRVFGSSRFGRAPRGGAWIETAFPREASLPRPVAPLVGARGLKPRICRPSIPAGSRPLRGGAWIETPALQLRSQFALSRPSWGRVD